MSGNPGRPIAPAGEQTASNGLASGVPTDVPLGSGKPGTRERTSGSNQSSARPIAQRLCIMSCASLPARVRRPFADAVEILPAANLSSGGRRRRLPTGGFFIYHHPQRTRPYPAAGLDHVLSIAEQATALGANFIPMPRATVSSLERNERPPSPGRRIAVLDEPYEYEHRRVFAEAGTSVGFPSIDLLDDFRAPEQFPVPGVRLGMLTATRVDRPDE